jgi:hypothetical protein
LGATFQEVANVNIAINNVRCRDEPVTNDDGHNRYEAQKIDVAVSFWWRFCRHFLCLRPDLHERAPVMLKRVYYVSKTEKP